MEHKITSITVSSLVIQFSQYKMAWCKARLEYWYVCQSDSQNEWKVWWKSKLQKNWKGLGYSSAFFSKSTVGFVMWQGAESGKGDIWHHKRQVWCHMCQSYHWKHSVVMMPTLSSLVAPQCHQWWQSWHHDDLVLGDNISHEICTWLWGYFVLFLFFVNI